MPISPQRSDDTREEYLSLLRRAVDLACQAERSKRGYSDLYKVGKLFGEPLARLLHKCLNGQVSVTKTKLKEIVGTVLNSRVETSLIAELWQRFPAYRDRVGELKSYDSGQQSMSLRQATSLIEERLPAVFRRQDLLEENALKEICCEMMDGERGRGKHGAAVTNSLALGVYIKSKGSALAEKRQAGLLLTVGGTGMYCAYQAGNEHVLKAHIRSLAYARTLADNAALAITNFSAVHFLDELRAAGHRNNPMSVQAMSLQLEASTSRKGPIQGRSIDLSVSHNGAKTLLEQGAPLNFRPASDKSTLAERLGDAPDIYRACGHLEGAAISRLTLASAHLRDGKFDQSIEATLSGMSIVKPTPETPYLTANGALSEHMGDIEEARNASAGPAVRSLHAVIWYRDALGHYRRSGSWQRAERVSRKLAAIA